MTRKVFTRTKTGCYTCRIRKIKCDEAKPSCVKCTGTGRKCDGYAPEQQQRKHSWPALLAASPLVPGPSIGRTGRVGRAMEFFQYIAAPNFSCYSDKEFWGHLVQAASHQEPAVRHAVIAIGSLQEQLWTRQPPAADIFALFHYNKALSLVTTRPQDSTVTLFLCLLFVCIEALRGNTSGSFEHCRHGINILNTVPVTPLARERLLPIFARHSVFPYLFDKKAQNFPLINIPTNNGAPYERVEQILNILDLLVARAFQFARVISRYRYGDKYDANVPERYNREHRNISTALEQWLLDFADFTRTHPPTSDKEKCLYAYAHMKGLCTKASFMPKLCRTEMGYDDDLSTFQKVLAVVEDVIGTSTPGTVLISRFSFDLGYLHFLCIAILRCRNLEVRRALVSAMERLVVKDDTLWHLAMARAMCRKVIELEHGISLDAFDRGEHPEATTAVVPDEVRIREIDLSAVEIRKALDAQGCLVTYLKLKFLYFANGSTNYRAEWVEMRDMDRILAVASRLKNAW